MESRASSRASALQETRAVVFESEFSLILGSLQEYLTYKKTQLVGPYRRPVPRVLGGSYLALDVAARSRVEKHSDTYEAARTSQLQTMVIRLMNTDTGRGFSIGRPRP